MTHKPIIGSDFIRMMKPILGLEGVQGIREIRITAEYNQAAIVKVSMIAKPDFEKATVEEYGSGEPEIKTRRYTVTVTEVME